MQLRDAEARPPVWRGANLTAAAGSIVDMEVRVLFFGVLKDVVGTRGDRVTLPERASVGDLVTHFEERLPELKRWRGSMAVSVNQEYAGLDVLLHAGDEVALLPPVSGGKREPVELPIRGPANRC
jgi:molybdopterin converting factor subunit 1